MNTSLQETIFQDTITIPAAPTVWEAVRHAQEQVPLGSQVPEGKSREDLLEEHLIARVVAHSQQNLTLPMRFHIEYQYIKKATQATLYDAVGGGGDGAVYASLWLILQGEEVHRAMVGVPSFFEMIAGEYHFGHEMYPDRDARQRLLGTPLFTGYEDLLDFDAAWKD